MLVQHAETGNTGRVHCEAAHGTEHVDIWGAGTIDGMVDEAIIVHGKVAGPIGGGGACWAFGTTGADVELPKIVGRLLVIGEIAFVCSLKMTG